jgi:hypothetical protein
MMSISKVNLPLIMSKSMLMFKPPILSKVEGLCASRPDYDVKGSQQNQEKLPVLSLQEEFR